MESYTWKELTTKDVHCECGGLGCYSIHASGHVGYASAYCEECGAYIETVRVPEADIPA